MSLNIALLGFVLLGCQQRTFPVSWPWKAMTETQLLCESFNRIWYLTCDCTALDCGSFMQPTFELCLGRCRHSEDSNLNLLNVALSHKHISSRSSMPATQQMHPANPLHSRSAATTPCWQRTHPCASG